MAENVTIDSLPAALFVAAFFASNPKIEHPAWAHIVACVHPLAVHSLKEASACLGEALRHSGAHTPLARRINEKILTAAVRQAKVWLGLGVKVVTKEEIGRPQDLGDDFPPVLFSWGDRTLLQHSSATVLNSRKPRKITPNDDWLLRTAALTDLARDEQLPLISSYGTTPYSLLTLLGKGWPLIAVCPDPLPFMQPRSALKSFFQDNAGLFLTKKTLFLSSFLPRLHLPRASRFAERDRLVGALASVFMVAEVRPGGNMDGLLQRARKTGKRIVVEAARAPRTVRRHPTHDSRDIGTDLPCPEHSRPRGYPILQAVPEGVTLLVHYTRGCPGPWPGQTPAKYFRSLLDAAPGASHTAFDTLRRILWEGLIRGGNRLTRGNIPVVSFTECMPGELADLVRWRRGLVRKWFEPYGIGIRKELLRALGAERVVYGDDKVYRKMPEERRHLFQFCTPASTDWAVEREWRLRGNLKLSDLSADDMFVIVQTDEEATLIRQEFDATVVCPGFGRSLPVEEADGGGRGK